MSVRLLVRRPPAPEPTGPTRIVLLKSLQLGLFKPGGPTPTPTPTAGSRPPPAPAAPEPAGQTPPAGQGWIPIAGSRHGGFHRPRAGGGFDYWYPGEGERSTPKDLGDQPFALVPQEADTPRDKSGRRVHNDVGEKVGGARKDRWAEIHVGNLGELEEEGEGEAHKHVEKAKVFRKYDADYDRGIGDTAGASRMKQFILSTIGSRPLADRLPGVPERTLSPERARFLYVTGATWLAKQLDACHTVQALDDFLAEWNWLTQHGDYVRAEVLTPERAAELQRLAPGGQGSTVYVRTGKQVPAKFGPPGRTESEQVQLDAVKLRAMGIDVMHARTIGGADTLRYRAPESANYAGYAAVMGPRLAALVGYGKRTDAWLQARGDARRREKENDWEGLGAKTGGAREKKGPSTHELIGMHRGGTPERVGGTAVPSRVDGPGLVSEFGLRAVEYGNWIDDAEAGAHLQHAYGAMADLADVIGVDHRMLAHGSKLALAFGARGSGWASAHYETDKVIINLTATRGGGTLAHEWGHFMDHQVPGGGFHVEGMNREATWGSHGRTDTLPEPVQDAYEGVMNAIMGGIPLDKRSRELKRKRTVWWKANRNLRRGTPEHAAAQKEWDAINKEIEDYNREARQVRYGGAAKPKPTTFATHASILGDYWERKHELFARAFESFVEDKIGEMGRKNTYLVAGTQEPYRISKVVNGEEVHGLEPYPQGEERKQINAAMEELMVALGSTGALRKALERQLFRRVPAGARIHVGDRIVVTP